MHRDKITLVAYAEDPLALLALHILDDHSKQLPDLTQVVVLLSETHASKRLRHLLLEKAEQRGINALLCPKIINIHDWSQNQINKYNVKTFSICGQHQRELILFDALTQHRNLLKSGSPWHLTDDLLKLFDQLTSNQNIIAEDYDDFEKEIIEAYGDSNETFSALGQEATLVHTLWNAWHSQLNAEQLIDSEAAHILGLNTDLKYNEQSLYIAGYHDFSIAEKKWLTQLFEKDRCYLYLHGQVNETPLDNNLYHPDTPISNVLDYFNYKEINNITNTYSLFLNGCYENNNIPFVERAKVFSKHDKNKVSEQLQLLFSQGHEEQAHAVELQVRRWLLDGKNNIGIVTENRRLARRVRALLERANITLNDLAGWSLSTTRAGAVLEGFLECIEDDFSHNPLLDILKSPFIFSQFDSQQVKQATYRLENDIIRHENIANNIQRYKDRIFAREKKLNWSSETSETLINILDALDNAAKLLIPLLKGSHSASLYIERLSDSLQIIGMTQLLSEDDAGVRILEVLDTLKNSAQQYPLEFSWTDFRTWLGRGLEKFVFTPEKTSSPVTLMGLGQSRLQKFDALIIASAEQEHLPGKANGTPFFNNAVRQQLKLTTTQNMMTERFHHFRRLLESAPHILITANNEDNAEEVPISPWLEIIHRFYQQAYTTSLEDTELKELVANLDSTVIRCEDRSVPEQTKQASTALPKELIPTHYSPSSYQTLMNCPYQFFATRGLKLATSEEVQEALSKSDYGERVHLCLEAFHQGKDSLDGPFSEKIIDKNKESAIQLLKSISHQVFSKDVDVNFEHRGWLAQWLKLIPAYIDWQIKHAAKWSFDKAEVNSAIKWKDNISLNGRLDRLDSNGNELHVIDYKTGKSASQTEIEQGEAVQLPFYALLANSEFNKPVSHVSYLNLSNKLKIGASIESDELDTISHKIGDRLSTIIQEMKDGKALTAWGDEDTCKYCTISRLCRKQAWHI